MRKICIVTIGTSGWISIGQDSIIAAGADVLKDVSARGIVRRVLGKAVKQ